MYGTRWSEFGIGDVIPKKIEDIELSDITEANKLESRNVAQFHEENPQKSEVGKETESDPPIKGKTETEVETGKTHSSEVVALVDLDNDDDKSYYDNSSEVAIPSEISIKKEIDEVGNDVEFSIDQT